MKQKISPNDAARQTLIQLSRNSLPPTPSNYTTAYNEIIGMKAEESSIDKILRKVLIDASKDSPKYIAIEKSITLAIKKQNWTHLEANFRKLLPNSNHNVTSETNWSVLIRTLIKKLETSHSGITLSRKKEGLSRVLTNFAKEPTVLAEKINALISAWGNSTSSVEVYDSQPSKAPNLSSDQTLPPTSEIVTISTGGNSHSTASQWQEMMLKTLELALIPQLDDASKVQQQAQDLLTNMRKKDSEQALTKHTKDLKNILLAIEVQRDDQHSINGALLDLLRLMTESMTELVIGDEWITGQIGIVSDIVKKPIDINTLYDAESSLKELIHKQSNLKPAVQDAKDLLKKMTETFISRLVEVTESTGDYQQKIETHQQKLSSVDGIDDLNTVLKSVLDDTRSIGLTVQRTREDFQQSQKKVTEAEQKIHELTAVLDHIGDVANEDYLTGTLNRRGMDDALAQEFSRADRHHTELSIAMIDIDHFKKLNDSLGHATGDEALIHFAKVIKDVKRSTDVLARYGGEEFIIILPTTSQKEAIKVIERVQRALTKNFFMHSDERVVITFSAGVAQRKTGESAESVVPRADAALYEAKNSGRNRVVGATLD